MYQTLEAMSREWEKSEFIEDSVEQMGAFSRDCNMDLQSRWTLHKVDLQNMMMSTSRPINSVLLKKVADDVNETVDRINKMPTFPGDNS